jgi:hypothetical protein
MIVREPSMARMRILHPVVFIVVEDTFLDPCFLSNPPPPPLSPHLPDTQTHRGPAQNPKGGQMV